ncbi:MAG: N-acetylmuramoyl-L-alanine amidase [Bacteroidetes bacterium CG12_big_fil_rev_8_21_14_0_65_60_17]|nr:MAG: N-acetylmuramoyl-L-alanine amidase [Bacteroidetes bacterium CG12_big_fil_rev_8_21_14_0_65_60_17]
MVFLSAVLCTSWFAHTARAQVTRVSFSPRSDDAGIVVRLHTSSRVQAFAEAPSSDAENSFVITLFNTRLDPLRVTAPPLDPVTSYRLREDGGHTTIRLALDGNVVETSSYRDAGSTDILIGIRTQSPVDRARWVLDTIVIDPGHGGQDLGARGPHGEREKDIVLAVAKKLGAYLKQLPDVEVVFTRTTDTFVPLNERGRLANEAGGKLFVSLHANSAPDRRAQGTETFFVGMHKSDAARRVMERENEVIRFEEDASVYEQYSPGDLVRLQLAQSAYMRHSETLASEIQSQFRDRVGRRNRGVKQAGFYVLWSASMPAVLVELGFLSNSSEARFMASDEGQTYLASAIFRSIRAFKESYEKGIHD